MFRPLSFRFRLPTRAALGLILLSTVLAASRSEAQPKGTLPFPEARLTAPMVRKVSAVMRAWDPTPGLGARLTGGDVGMSPEKFKALPDSQKERIIVENRRRAEAKHKEGEKQISQLMVGSLADRTAAAERIPALKAALGRSGLSASEFVQVFHAYNQAMVYVITEEGFPDAVRPLPPGTRHDNVALIRPMTKAEELWTVMGLTGR